MKLLAALYLGLVWLANGFLVLGYLLFERLWAVLLLPLLWLWLRRAEGQYRIWTLTAFSLVLTAALAAPAPVPGLLFLMAAVSVVSLYLEQFDPLDLEWRHTGALALYALAAIGLWLQQAYFAPAEGGSGAQGGLAGTLSKGSSYLGVIGGVAMYLMPLGHLGLTLQRIWVHAPLGRTPADLINLIRHRERRS